MLFTKLSLTGFKSFVDHTELLIEPGMTGIVGPNGCGKSNLVEALQWAMGENSARRLPGAWLCGPILGGSLSDRLGRAPVIVLLASLSAVTTMTLGWLAAAPFWIVVSMAVVAQFLAVGDSPVLVTARTEVVTSRSQCGA